MVIFGSQTPIVPFPDLDFGRLLATLLHNLLQMSPSSDRQLGGTVLPSLQAKTQTVPEIMDGCRTLDPKAEPFVRLGFAEAVKIYGDQWSAGLSVYYAGQGLHLIAHGIRHTSEMHDSQVQDSITNRYKTVRTIALAADALEGGKLQALDRSKRKGR